MGLTNPTIIENAGLLDVDEHGEGRYVSADVTLRDLFAAAALVGQEAHSAEDRNYEESAEVAYKTADAMLIARIK